MSYSYMSNINNFSNVTEPDKAYLEAKVYTGVTTPSHPNLEGPEDGIIEFKKGDIKYSASFLMIRARTDNDVLIELSPSNYGVYIPAGELWSVDSLDTIDKFYIRNAFTYQNDNGVLSTTTSTTCYIQWMIGYK